MTSKTMESAQEAFYAALRQSAQTVTDLKRSRLKGTAELPALQIDKEGQAQIAAAIAAEEANKAMESASPEQAQEKRSRWRRRRSTSKIHITIPKVHKRQKTSEFEATMALVKRLSTLGSEDEAGEIICLSSGIKDHPSNSGFSCSGIQSFWTRAGRDAPPVMYSEETLQEVLPRRPVAIFVDPAVVPDEVPGYIRAIMTEPLVCMLLREE